MVLSWAFPRPLTPVDMRSVFRARAERLPSLRVGVLALKFPIPAGSCLLSGQPSLPVLDLVAMIARYMDRDLLSS